MTKIIRRAHSMTFSTKRPPAIVCGQYEHLPGRRDRDRCMNQDRAGPRHLPLDERQQSVGRNCEEMKMASKSNRKVVDSLPAWCPKPPLDPAARSPNDDRALASIYLMLFFWQLLR